MNTNVHKLIESLPANYANSREKIRSVILILLLGLFASLAGKSVLSPVRIHWCPFVGYNYDDSA